MASQVINIVYGPHDLARELAGLSIGELHGGLSDIMSLPVTFENLQAFVNGTLVGSDYVTKPGDRVEFMRIWGEKGLGKIFTKEEFMAGLHLTEADWQDWVANGLPFDRLRNGMIILNETQIDDWKRSQRPAAWQEKIGLGIEKIAEHLCPEPPEKVNSRYVATKLGQTTKWIGEMAANGKIPKSCIVPGTGNGKQWRFYRAKIDKWIEER